jgi:hypothetical protein
MNRAPGVARPRRCSHPERSQAFGGRSNLKSSLQRMPLVAVISRDQEYSGAAIAGPESKSDALQQSPPAWQDAAVLQQVINEFAANLTEPTVSSEAPIVTAPTASAGNALALGAFWCLTELGPDILCACACPAMPNSIAARTMTRRTIESGPNGSRP